MAKHSGARVRVRVARRGPVVRRRGHGRRRGRRGVHAWRRAGGAGRSGEGRRGPAAAGEPAGRTDRRRWWSCRAGPDRRGLGPAARGPGPDPGRVRRRGGGRARHGRRPGADRRGDRARHRHRRRPHAADPHGRGAAGGHRAPPRATGDAGARALAVRGGALRQRAALRPTRRPSATSSRSGWPTSRTSSMPSTAWPAAERCWTPRWWRSCWPGAAAGRWTRSRRASGRCWRSWRRAARTPASPRPWWCPTGRREAHLVHLRELGLAPTDTEHRRVLAVLTWLQG